MVTKRLFMFCWACFRLLPNTISMKLHFMLYQTIKNAKKEKRSSRRPSNQVELSRHSIMDHLFMVVQLVNFLYVSWFITPNNWYIYIFFNQVIPFWSFHTASLSPNIFFKQVIYIYIYIYIYSLYQQIHNHFYYSQKFNKILTRISWIMMYMLHGIWKKLRGCSFVGSRFVAFFGLLWWLVLWWGGWRLKKHSGMQLPILTQHNKWVPTLMQNFEL